MNTLKKFLIASFSSPAFLVDGILAGIFILRTRKDDKIFNYLEEDIEEDMEENDSEQLSIAIIDDQAYWVLNNAFYVADIVDGEIDRESSRIIDPFSMSRSDVKKMLFILDNIVEG